MSGNKFNLIAQEISKQYQTMEELKLENHRLHQQLTDLREGRGVFVEIEGQRFAVNVATTSLTPAQATMPSTTTTTTTSASDAPIIAASATQIPLTRVVEKIHEEPTEITPVEKTVKRPATFLEEIMLDEFANALTSSTTGESPSAQKVTSTSELIDEDQKAALRKELLGSYLLE